LEAPSFTALTNGKTYRVSFWVKGSFESIAAEPKGGVKVILKNSADSTLLWLADRGLSQLNVGETKNGWINYYKDIQANSAFDILKIRLQHLMNAMLDEVTITEVNSDGTLGNIILNEGFENFMFGDTLSAQNAAGVTYNYKGSAFDEYDLNVTDWTMTPDTTDGIMKVVPAGRNGGNALYLWKSTFENNKSLRQEGVTLEPGTYTLECYIRGWRNANNSLGWYFNTNGNWIFNAGGSEWNWTKYQKTFTLTEKTTQTNYWFISTNRIGVLIDDIKLYNTENPDVNLLANGDFEETYSPKQNNDILSNWDLGATASDDSYLDASVYSEVSTDEAFDGTHSLHMTYAQPNRTAGCYTKARDFQLLPTGKYDISFYAKGIYNEAGVQARIGDKDTLLFTAYNKEDAKDGWTKYYLEDVENTVEGATFGFIADMDVTSLYIDNVVVTKADEEKNLIFDGSFEDIDVPNTTELENPILYPVIAGGAATLSWKNPSVAVDNISVTLNGQSFSCTPDLDKNAYNEIMISNLTNGQEYTVVLSAVIGSNNYEKTLTVIPNKGSEYENMGAWNIGNSQTKIDNTTYYANYIATLEDDAANNTYFKLQSNINERRDNLFTGISQNVSANTKNMYRLSFDAKVDGVYQFIVSRNSVGVADTQKDFQIVFSNNARSSDWRNYSIDIVGWDDEGGFLDTVTPKDYTLGVKLGVTKIIGSVCIDNVKLYALNEAEEITSDNLLKNSDFETDSYVIEDAEYSKIVDGEIFPVNTLENGQIIVSAKIKNINEGENFSPTVIVAFYKDGQMLSATTIKRSIAELPANIPADEITTTVNVPDDLSDGNYSIKVMYWNGVDTLVPLGESDVLKEAQN